MGEVASTVSIRNVQSRGSQGVRLIAAALAAALLSLSPANAEEQSNCVTALRVLWGDGVHDDTAALNAWFRGEQVLGRRRMSRSAPKSRIARFC